MRLLLLLAGLQAVLARSLPAFPSIPAYSFSSLDNSSLSTPHWSGVLSQGSLLWPNITSSAAKFHVLSSLITPSEVDQILEIVKSPQVEFDVDLDTVDRSSTYEFYVEKGGSAEGVREIEGKPDRDERVFQQRRPMREDLSSVMNPIIENRILPFVNEKYREACSLSNSSCRVCHSLVRRYSEEERLVHPPHFDLQALVTVVVSLSSYGKDFDGGLYVSTGAGLSQAKYVAMQAGDAVVHQSNLLHGVRVEKGARWSWILWLKDTDDCRDDEDHLLKWTNAEAESGDPIAQFLQGKRTSFIRNKLYWFNQSATSGFFESCNEMGQFYSENSVGQKNIHQAAKWFLKATEVAPDDPKAFYNLGRLAIEEQNIMKAVHLFEKAALNGLTLAAFNMAVAYYKGQGVEQDLTLAALWMEKADSGNSWMIAYQLWTDMGEHNKALIALTRSGQTGHLPALKALVSLALPLCDSLLLRASASLLDVDGNVREDLEFQKYHNKLMSDVTAILKINPSDEAALNVCLSENFELCERELKKKVITWLQQAVKMGCDECQTDLKTLIDVEPYKAKPI